MHTTLAGLTLVIATLFSSLAGANSNGMSERHYAHAQRLAQSEQWRHLLHYHQVGLFSTDRSQIDDPSFFISAAGATNPFAELLATMAAFQSNATSIHCRFPARFHWLKTTLPDIFPTKAPCDDYDAWLDELSPQGLTLIFPAAYIDGASSMFGHSLLRIDGAKNENPLLDYTINYAASADPNDHPLLFTYKGLSGGYPGAFSILPYYEKVTEYSHMEARDIWEYELSLTQEELAQFVRHVWEIKDVQFDYYFLSENCAYQLLTLLDATAERFDFADDFSSHVIPSDTIRSLDRAGLINDVHFRASSLTKLKAMQSQMAKDHVLLAKNMIASTSPQLEELSALNTREQAGVLDIAYAYTRYLANSTMRDDQALAARSLSVLSMRSEVKTKYIFVPPATPSTRHDRGHDTYRAAFSFGRALDKNFLQAGLRLAYHDWLDALSGYAPGAKLEMFHAELRQWLGRDAGFQLEQFRLIDMASLSPRDTLLEPRSWYLSAGLKRPVYQPDELSPYFSGATGLSYGKGETLLSLLLAAELNLDNDFASGYRVAVGPELVWIGQFNAWSTQFGIQKPFDIAGAKFKELSTHFAIAYQLDHHWQARLKTQHQNFNRSDNKNEHDFSARVSIMRYF